MVLARVPMTLLSVACLLLVYLLFPLTASTAPLVPALFIFGDSLADAGNNNNLATLAKANFPPYGIDFPGGVATGRFSDGYNAADYIGFKLGLPLIPIYADPATKLERLLQGVNFASGASGVEPYSGRFFGALTPLDVQIQNFRKVKQEIIQVIGQTAADKLLAEAGYYVITGSNDWVNAYFAPLSPLRSIYTVTQFRDVLITKLVSQVEAIYNAGGRRIAVPGLAAVGCSPSLLLKYGTDGKCVGYVDGVAKDYNENLKSRFLALNGKLPNATIIYNNVFDPLTEAVQNPSAFGFKIVNQACCGIGKFGGFLNCNRGFPVCKDVEDYLFWDAYHPTQKFSRQLVEILWNNGPPYSYPVSVRELFKQ